MSEVFFSFFFFFSMLLHRFLWEQKVAKKVKVCELFSQLSSCTLFGGAKSCANIFETFTFDNNRAIWSKSLPTFCVANVSEESCTAEIIPVRGSTKTWPVLEGHTTHTVCSTKSHARAPHDAHHTKYGHHEIESIDNQSEEVAVAQLD